MAKSRGPELVPLDWGSSESSAAAPGRTFNRARPFVATAAGLERAADGTLVASFRGLPFARAEGVIVVPCANGDIVVCGGATGIERNLADVARWSGGAWHTLPSLPRGRAHGFGAELTTNETNEREIVLFDGHVAAWHGDEVVVGVDHFDGRAWRSHSVHYEGDPPPRGTTVSCRDERTGRVFRLESEARGIRLWVYAGGGRFVRAAFLPAAASVTHDLAHLALAFDVNSREVMAFGRLADGREVAVHAPLGELLDSV